MERATVVDATSMARKILRDLEKPFEIVGQTLDVDASIGVALCPDHGDDAGALLRRADIAMYVAKHSHDGFTVYAARLDLHSPDRLSLLGELRRSIDQGHLFLAYQPLIRIPDRKLVGMEALVRWQHPVHGLISPDGFISLAEGTGAIKPLTIWVLNEALRQCSEWRLKGLDLEVSVNISARNLHDVSLAATVLDSLLKYQVPPNRLTLEITESAIMSDPSSAMIVLSRLSNMGVHLAIDDFGTGYSSLAYLQRLPTRNIKIDKSFVLRLCENANDAAIVRAIIELGHSLGHTVLAEGVEDESVLALLAQFGCDFAQGYFFSKPLPAPEIEDWIREHL
jgi:EAL domain-containing protein (putative c-di-GMP-specific phosphodiesterase class I)